eukprot:33939_1
MVSVSVIRIHFGLSLSSAHNVFDTTTEFNIKRSVPSVLITRRVPCLCLYRI